MPEDKESALRTRIVDLAYEVTQNAATEYAFTGQYDNFCGKGLYVDIVDGQPFTSMTKYDPSCGWHAFLKFILYDRFDAEGYGGYKGLFK